MSRRKAAETPSPFADGPPPAEGGAWVRQKDGTLVRDGETEQKVPDGEGDTIPERSSAPTNDEQQEA